MCYEVRTSGDNLKNGKQKKSLLGCESGLSKELDVVISRFLFTCHITQGKYWHFLCLLYFTSASYN